MKIALITPVRKEDYLVNTVIDGLLDLGTHECRISSDYPTYLPVKGWKLPPAEFLEFARQADLVILFWGKGTTDLETAKKIGRWNKTVFIDGSELGHNLRLDPEIRQQVASGTYQGRGAIDRDMLEKCALYFRREKPYSVPWSQKEIVPLPFGIERRYAAGHSPEKTKNIDFTCIFGQEEYPPLRRQVRERLERFCRENGFTCETKGTAQSRLARFFGLKKSDGGRERFYDILSRTKVGVSVGGGGFDTARFWEILGNNCILLTETIDIYEKGSSALGYKRISEFKDEAEFEARLAELAAFLRNGYDKKAMAAEYADVMANHSTRARAERILNEAVKKGIIG